MTDEPPPRRTFRVTTRRRDAYEDAVMVDVQLQLTNSGQIVWSQSFSDTDQAEAFERELEGDLDDLDDAAFRSKYGVPPSA